MKVYELVHFQNTGEHYEDRVDYEDHYLYSTLEKAEFMFDKKTQDVACIGSWSVLERELDNNCHTGVCLHHSNYIPCPPMFLEERCNDCIPDTEMTNYAIEYAFKEAAGMTYMGVDDWNSDWDTENRNKQITRLAHELADRHEHLSIFDWVNLVYPFYQMYELGPSERELFSQEYSAQHYLRYGYV